MEENYKIVVKTMFGLEDVLMKELADIGAQEIEKHNRAVSFIGNDELLYKANYYCRTALRVLKPLKTIPAKDQDELYREIAKINWEDYFLPSDTFAIDSTITLSNFTNSMFVSLKAKDAVVDKFRAKFNVRPSVDIEHPDVRINIHIYKEEATVSLDSSGSSLHKRGYRTAATKAPINEVLAAGLILLSGWDPEKPFIDPMTGSGTFAIEAAMIGQNIPAGYYRRVFGFEKWRIFNRKLWDQILAEGEENINEKELQIFASDSAVKSIDIAKENIKEAQLRNVIKLSKADFFEMNAEDMGITGGTIILNPPYGERLDKDDDILQLYADIGKTFKHNFQNFDAWIISSNMDAFKNVGLKPSKKIVIYNGPLECRFNHYKLFGGTHKENVVNKIQEAN